MIKGRIVAFLQLFVDNEWVNSVQLTQHCMHCLVYGHDWKHRFMPEVT